MEMLFGSTIQAAFAFNRGAKLKYNETGSQFLTVAWSAKKLTQIAFILTSATGSVSLALTSQNTLVTIFRNAQPKSWRCINNSSSSSLSLSSSSRGDVSHVCGLKPGTWEWVGGHESSIVAERGLVCGRRFLVAVPASMFFIDSLLGNESHVPAFVAVNLKNNQFDL